MPRFRDFPFNGVEFLKAWKSSLVNKVMQDINESKSKTIENNQNIMINNDVDVNNWSDVEKLATGLIISLSYYHHYQMRTKKFSY